MEQFTGQNLVCIRAERVVFANLSFGLTDGGAMRLSGANGSGKSSLLRVMARLLPAAAGSLAWNGANLDEDPDAHDARLAYVGHHDAIKPLLTVAENVAFWARLGGGGPSGGSDGGSGAPGGPAAAASRGLSAMGLEAMADIPCRLLSAGQRRRLALARLFAAPGKLWLLDEPTVGLDAASVAALEAGLAAHREEGGMVVLATHVGLALPDAYELELGDFSAPQGAAALA